MFLPLALVQHLLPASICLRLQKFVNGMQPNENVFKLKPPCITMKIKSFARRAGLDNLHTHSLRHKYAITLLERGVDIRTVQELLGHESLSTTQIYLSVTDKRLREAVDTLDEKPDKHGVPVFRGDYTILPDRFDVKMPVVR